MPNRWRTCSAAISLAIALALGNVDAAGAASPVPSPTSLVVGAKIALPAALFSENAPGSPVLVTPTQANSVAHTMWRLWERALVANDTRAVSQLMAPTPLLRGILENCAFPEGKCVPESKPRVARHIVSIVPPERSFPLYFLTETRTTDYVELDNGSDAWQPWVELQVMTKANSSAPWQISFDTGYADNGGTAPLLLHFTEAKRAYPGIPPAAYNARPTLRTTIAPVRQLSLLAQNYESYKVTGEPSSNSPFNPDGVADEIGASLATSPQGDMSDGFETNYSFAPDKASRSWKFVLSGSYGICGTVLDTVVDTPLDGPALLQNADRTNWGMALRPGLYSSITTKVTHPTCIFQTQEGYDLAGDSGYTTAVTGTRVS